MHLLKNGQLLMRSKKHLISYPPQIALYGRTGVGKSYVANYLTRAYGYTACKPGKACREIAQRLFKNEDKAVLNHINDAMREIDPNVWLRIALEEASEGNPIVVDGMRFASNFEFLKEKGFLLIKIVANKDIREARLKCRNQKFSFEVDEKHASEIELDEFKFDYIIKNNKNDPSAIQQSVDDIIEKF